jgi:hypothetical protein
MDTQQRRRAIEAEVERLIALLDELDGNPDFEPDFDAEECVDEASLQPLRACSAPAPRFVPAVRRARSSCVRRVVAPLFACAPDHGVPAHISSGVGGAQTPRAVSER